MVETEDIGKIGLVLVQHEGKAKQTWENFGLIIVDCDEEKIVLRNRRNHKEFEVDQGYVKVID